MAPAREWGFLCPVDGGLLLVLKGARGLYCSNVAHNGRPSTHPLGASEPTPAFFDRDQVQEGYATVAKETSGSGLTEKQIKAMHAAAKADPESDAKAEAAANGTQKVRSGRAPKDCECGCGGQTKGGRFLPGHDAKYHSALRKAEEAKVAAAG